MLPDGILTLDTPKSYGKAQLCEWLHGRLHGASVPESHLVRRADWLSNRAQIAVELLGKCQPPLIVRSSAPTEDRAQSSQAGRYLSVASVTTKGQLEAAIDAVLDSYDRDEPDDILFVQEMTTGVACVGVAFSADPETGSPYLIVNYAETDRTDAITSGRASYSTWIALGRGTSSPPLGALQHLPAVLAEIQDLCGIRNLDVEFAVGAKDIHVFQVRELTIKALSPPRVEALIYVNRELSKVANVCERLNGWLALLKRLPNVDTAGQMGFEDAIGFLRNHNGLALTARELRLIEETLDRAQQLAPVMVGRMVEALISQLVFYRIRTFHTDDELRSVLAAEREGDLIPDERPITIPSGFAPIFKKRLFPVVYNRLWQNLRDTAAVPEAVADVFVDFIVRIKDQAGSSGADALTDPRHEEFLRLLCDRATARLNGVLAESSVAAESAEAAPIKSARRAGLPDAIIKEVGDRLARLSG